MTTANKITVTRIMLIPVFVMMAIYYGRGMKSGHPRDWQRIAAIFLFLTAAASDGLDGYVARRYNQRSPPWAWCWTPSRTSACSWRQSSP